MKTRAEIYANEAADLLRTVTMYPGLSEQQLLCFHPGKEVIAKALLSHLERQGRIFQADSDGFFLTGQTPKTDRTLCLLYTSITLLTSVCSLAMDCCKIWLNGLETASPHWGM